MREERFHEAENKARQVDYLLMRLKQGLITIPEKTDPVEFFRLDGKVAPSPVKESLECTLATLRDKYIKTHEAPIEANTFECIKIHFRQFVRHFGEPFVISNPTLEDLQGYVDIRLGDD